MAKLKNEVETDSNVLLRLKSVVSAARFKEIEGLPLPWVVELFKDELLLGKQGKELRALHHRFNAFINDPDAIISDEIFTFFLGFKFSGALQRCNDLILRSNRSDYAVNLSNLDLEFNAFPLTTHEESIKICWLITSKALMMRDLLIGSYELYLDYEILTMACEKYMNPTIQLTEKVQEKA